MGVNMPIEGQYNLQQDVRTHPPVNPATHRPYDSVVYFENDCAGNDYLRVAIYDVGQIYPEYVFHYTRVGQGQGQGQPQQPQQQTPQVQSRFTQQNQQTQEQQQQPQQQAPQVQSRFTQQ